MENNCKNVYTDAIRTLGDIDVWSGGLVDQNSALAESSLYKSEVMPIFNDSHTIAGTDYRYGYDVETVTTQAADVFIINSSNVSGKYEFSPDGVWYTNTNTFTSPTTPHMPKFKKGDRLQVKQEYDSGSICNQSQHCKFRPDEIYEVVETEAEGKPWYTLLCIGINPIYGDVLMMGKKIRTCVHSHVEDKFVRISFNPSPSIIMGVVQAARNLLLSKEDKLFKKVGLKDDCSNFTEAARQAFLERQMVEDAKNPSGILQVLAAELKAEQDEEKKDCKSC